MQKIRQHSRQMVRELDVIRGAYMDTGFTLSQCHVLFELSQHGSLTLMEIADNLLIDKSNTSRTVKKLIELGVIRADKVQSDSRQKLFSLTKKGEKVLLDTTSLANNQVHKALEHLSVEQHEIVTEGLRLYASALKLSRLQSAYTIRPIKKADDKEVARLIRQVLTEFKAVGEGYSIQDPEVDTMSATYRNAQSCYFVIATETKLVGCGGIAPLKGEKKTTCELQKMFLLPEARGIGLGRKLLTLLLNEATSRGYEQCYLETLDRMHRANDLYIRNGFEPLPGSMGATGHCSCDRWYVKQLS
ncbi:MAG: GNAT family N-acetyltransferase [Planctomycetaceae bacterium]